MSNYAGAVLVIAGFLAAGYGVVALFFLCFWWDTGDRLFLSSRARSVY